MDKIVEDYHTVTREERVNQLLIDIQELINYCITIEYINFEEGTKIKNNIEYEIANAVDYLITPFKAATFFDDALNNKKNQMMSLKLLTYLVENITVNKLNDQTFEFFDYIIWSLLRPYIRLNNFEAIFVIENEELLSSLFSLKLVSSLRTLPMILLELIKTEKYSLVDSLFQKLQGETFEYVFDQLLNSIKRSKKKYPEICIELLNKWAENSQKEDYNILIIKSFLENNDSNKTSKEIKTSNDIEEIKFLKNDFKSNFSKIYVKIAEINKYDSDLALNIVNDLFYSYTDLAKEDEIIANGLLSVGLYNADISKLILNNDIIMKNILSIVLNYNDVFQENHHEKQMQYPAIYNVTSNLFYNFIRNKSYGRAKTFVENIIKESKNAKANNFIYHTLYQIIQRMLSYNDAMVKEIVYSIVKDYGNADLLSYYNSQSNAIKIINNEVDINNLILSGECLNNGQNIRNVNSAIKRILDKNLIIEDYLDIEKIVEYIILNESTLTNVQTIISNKEEDDGSAILNSYQTNGINYFDIYISSLSKIDSEKVLDSLINNNIIQNKIKKLFTNYIDGKFDGNSTSPYFFGIIDKLKVIIRIKNGNPQIMSLIDEYINCIKDQKTSLKVKKELFLFQQLYNKKSYDNIESIEKLNTELCDLISLRDNMFMAYFKNYEEFILNTCEANYKYVVKFLLDYHNRFKKESWINSSIDKLLVAIYQNYGFDIYKNILLFDSNFLNIYCNNVEDKAKIIYSLTEIDGSSKCIDVLSLIFINTENDNKYILIKKLLSSTNYRKIITLEELGFLNGKIDQLSDENQRLELQKKSNALQKKMGV